MTTGSQLAVTGKSGSQLGRLNVVGPCRIHGPSRWEWAAEKAGPVGGLGWPTGAGAWPAGLESVRRLWSQAGLSSRAKRGFSILA